MTTISLNQNEGNQYIVKHKGTQYSDLIVKFKIKEMMN